jgi:GNAT superfamily N-acetyltransferase
MEISVIKAGMEDLEAIQEIAWNGWYPYYLQIISEAQIRYMYANSYSNEALAQQMKEAHQFLLLKADDEFAVMASFGPFMNENQSWKLHKLYSDPKFQGKGLGKTMLNAVCKLAREQGGKTMQLNVNRKNPTYEFYLKYGFKVLWEEDIPFGSYWMNDYRMSKKL